METSSFPSTILFGTHNNYTSIHNSRNNRIKLSSQPCKIRAISEVAATTTADPAQVELTWEIVVGALAGVTPFVVAGIEFSQRIVSFFLAPLKLLKTLVKLEQIGKATVESAVC
ncbi:hypothetical protein IFM89_019163 [Coptis chinensis]|uniref:Uncharacterized protein n=1 Tax=Coptis chinensis TaxID=261450 RepID=A0A835H042_9MAGN|nr:hypothetical protein IFM89_019163 [Coptis chinensis]